MATTGFWPVKSRLKEVIDYAENPDKTIDKRYVDSDLYAALQLSLIHIFLQWQPMTETFGIMLQAVQVKDSRL